MIGRPVFRDHLPLRQEVPELCHDDFGCAKKLAEGLFLCQRRPDSSAALILDVLAKVSIDPSCYRIKVPAVPTQANQPAIPEDKVEDEPCFLKAIFDDTYANTATNVVLAIRNLANLREYIKTVPEYNIITFHQYVKEQLQELEVAN